MEIFIIPIIMCVPLNLEKLFRYRLIKIYVNACEKDKDGIYIYICHTDNVVKNNLRY